MIEQRMYQMLDILPVVSQQQHSKCNLNYMKHWKLPMPMLIFSHIFLSRSDSVYVKSVNLWQINISLYVVHLMLWETQWSSVQKFQFTFVSICNSGHYGNETSCTICPGNTIKSAPGDAANCSAETPCDETTLIKYCGCIVDIIGGC